MKHWSKRQIKGQCLNGFYHQNVIFFIGGICETLECNADASQGLWHSEKERQEERKRREGEKRPENTAPYFA